VGEAAEDLNSDKESSYWHIEQWLSTWGVQVFLSFCRIIYYSLTIQFLHFNNYSTKHDF